MIQEYLLMDAEDKEKVSSFDSKGITMTVSEMKDQNIVSVRFSVKGENEDSARKLSEIDVAFCSQFKVSTLENGCSAYMNQRLYPLVSEFERKLRKLLYIASATHRDDAAAKNISDLESKDFGNIFSMLFIDGNFMNSVKEAIKTRQKDVFSKADIMAYIESVDENTVWDELLGKEAVPNLRKRFNDVRHYRNDVMHSHNIEWKNYKDAKKLYEDIIEELDSSIPDIAGQQEPKTSYASFNKTLQEVLKKQDERVNYSEIAQVFRDVVNQNGLSPDYSALTKQFAEVAKQLQPSEEIVKIQEQWKAMSESLVPSESMRSLIEIANRISAIKADIPPAILEIQNITRSHATPKIEILPALIKLQQSLSEFPTLSNQISDHTNEIISPENEDGGKE